MSIIRFVTLQVLIDQVLCQPPKPCKMIIILISNQKNFNVYFNDRNKLPHQVKITLDIITRNMTALIKLHTVCGTIQFITLNKINKQGLVELIDVFYRPINLAYADFIATMARTCYVFAHCCMFTE